ALACYERHFTRMCQVWSRRVIPGRRSEAQASPESRLPDLRLWIPGSRPAAEPRNDGTKVLTEYASSLGGEASLLSLIVRGNAYIYVRNRNSTIRFDEVQLAPGEHWRRALQAYPPPAEVLQDQSGSVRLSIWRGTSFAPL